MNSLRTIGIIAWREIRKLAADRWTVLAITAIPLVVGILLASIYARQVVLDIPTVVIDRDGTAASRAVARAIDAHESLRLVRTAADGEDEEGIIRSGEASCVVTIPPEFESRLKRGEASPALCMLNGSNMVLSNYALKAISGTMTTVTAGIAMEKLEKTGTPSTHALSAYAPLAVTPRYMFNPAQNYANFFIPGILAALLQQIVVIGAALTWVREFRSGEIIELIGITRNTVILSTGKLIVYLLVGAVWALFLFAGLFPLFGVPYNGSVLAGALAVILMTAGMALLAMFISSVFTHRETAMQVMFIVSSPAFLVSGYTFPQLAMPAAIKCLGYIVPLTPFLAAWRKTVLYGGGIADIMPEVGMMTLGIVIYAGLMLVVLKKRFIAFDN
jgi:ABC-2 type transport system permease protein